MIVSHKIICFFTYILGDNVSMPSWYLTVNTWRDALWGQREEHSELRGRRQRLQWALCLPTAARVPHTPALPQSPFKHTLWQELPSSSEREKEKCAGSLLFSEGCTGFNSQISIYSLIFIILPDSFAHCKKISFILLICLHQILSSLFSTFHFLPVFFCIFIWTFPTLLIETLEKSTILSNSLTLNMFLCSLSPVYELHLRNPVLSITSLSYCASARFMVPKQLCCLHFIVLLSFLYCISYK